MMHWLYRRVQVDAFHRSCSMHSILAVSLLAGGKDVRCFRKAFHVTDSFGIIPNPVQSSFLSCGFSLFCLRIVIYEHNCATVYS